MAVGWRVAMAGALYGSIDRMIRDRLIEETRFTDDARRRYYRITSFGQKVLAAEAARLKAALESIRPISRRPQTSGARP